MKVLLSRMKSVVLSAMMICFIGTLICGQNSIQKTGNQEKKEQKKKVLKEDIKGREKYWKKQRAYPGKRIPPGARQKAMSKKRLMQESVVGQNDVQEDLKGRLQWWYYQRSYPAKSIPKNARQKAIHHKNGMKSYWPEGFKGGKHHSPPVSGVCNWVSIGPRNINGRIRCLAIHPTDGNIIYAGAAEGGVWKSTDSGQSWYPLMQYEFSIAVGALAIDPTNPDIIYAGTGEPTWWPGYEGIGVLKSTDGGDSWVQTGEIENGHIARLTIDPTNTNTVYCAGYSGGLYKTTNGGTNWSLIKAGDVTDFALNPSSSDTLYLGIRDDGVYKSTDSGSSWNKLEGGLPILADERVMLSLCPVSPNTVYAKLDQTVYKTTDGGTNWTDLGSHGGSTYGYWCNHVTVDPTDPDIVFAAGISVEKSSNGGTTWDWVSGGSDPEKDKLHADQHAMVFDPANHLKIYASNDGGVYLSNDGADTWKKVSDGLIVTQFYDVGISTATPSMLGGGTQDQGTNVTTGGLTWEKVYGADGGFLVFHPTDHYIVYGETQYNNIKKSTDGGDSWSPATTGLAGAGPWIGAIEMDQTSPDTLFTGRQEVFRTTDGAGNWTVSSPTVGGDVLAIAIAPSDNLTVYAGTSNGSVWRSTDGGAALGNWSDVTSSPLPNRFVTDIVVDQTDPDIVYLTFSGFSISTPTAPGHVFRSTDGGANWVSIDGVSPNDLPDIPANAIEIDANNSNVLYVGTDIGVFRTENLGVTWTVFESGLPQAAVIDLELYDNGEILTAATHGRAMWQIRVNGPPDCTDVDIYIRDNLLDTGRQIPSPHNVIDPLSVVRGGSIGDKVYRCQSPDIKVDSEPYYIPDALFDGVEFDRDLLHDDPVRTQVNHVYVQVHNRGPFDAHNVTVKILWAEPSAGLPAFPTDFWTNYPNDSSDTSVWHPIGSFQTISVLEPTRPVVLSWDWTPPAAAATHSCILAVIDSPDDPIPAANKVLSVNWLIRNEKHIGLKNLHVIDASAVPGPLPLTEIYFHNDLNKQQRYDFVIDRRSFPIEGKLSLQFSKLKTQKPLKMSISSDEIILKRGCWLRRLFACIFPFIKPPSIKLLIIDPEEAVIKDVILKPHGKVRAKLKFTIPQKAQPGNRYRVTIMQRQGKQILGASTYEIRINAGQKE